MKKSINIASLFALTSLVFTTLAWSNTATLSEVAEEFFVSARNGDEDRMTSVISPQWQNSMEPKVFARFLNVLGLDDYQSATWQGSEIGEGTGQLKGEFKSSKKTSLVTLNFVKQGESWLINSISSGPISPPVKLPMPDYDATVALVSNTMQQFAVAVNAQDMKLFYDQASETFRIRQGIEDLEQAFGQFYQTGDFKQRVAGVPGLARPTLENGYLIIEGGYLVGGYKTRFKLDYATEDGVWKIIGFGISSNPDEAPKND